MKNYALYLNQLCRVTVATPAYKNVVDNYPFPVYRYQSLPLGERVGYRAGNPFNPETLRDLRAQKFDIIHAHAPCASSMLARVLNSKRKRKVPIVLTYHTKYEFDIAKRVPQKPFQKIALEFLLDNLNAVDEVWTVTRKCGEALRNIGYRGNYLVMENGTDFAFGRAPEDKVIQLREAYNIEDDCFVFLFVGRMMWYKNIKVILDSLVIAKKKGLPFRVFMVGSGNDAREIREYAIRCGLEDQVIFTGPIYDREYLRVFYSAADIFLFPSTYDTSGIVVKEAAACNCPALLVRDSCAAEGVQHNVSGFLAEDETPEACAAALLDACQSQSHLEYVSKQAGKLLYLSWETVVQRAYTRYQEILDVWPGPLPYNSRSV